MVFSDFDACMLEESAEFRLVRLFQSGFFLSHRRISTGHHVACVSNLSKTESKTSVRNVGKVIASHRRGTSFRW